MTEDITDFGYRKVKKEEKAQLVKGVFDSVADRYDLMNDLMSLGIHRLWKRITIELSGVRAGHYVLDLAAGTGDLSERFAGLVGDQGMVLMTDINLNMLLAGQNKMIDRGHLHNLHYAQVNAEQLPFPDNTFDCISIGFGLRNVTDKLKALQAMYQALKPGGRVLVLEFSKPIIKPLQAVYDLYSFSVLPKLGRWVTHDEDSYRYLAESIRMHPDQESLKAMMESVGFERCDYYNLTGGIVAIHRGFKL